jgi:ankyrin repeat protein
MMDFSSELYYSYVLSALDRADMGELKRIYYLSTLNKEGEEISSLITSKIPELARTHGLPIQNTFQELYNNYKYAKMVRRVNHMPLTWIRHYLEKEDMSALLYALGKRNDIREDDTADEFACIAGRKSLSFVKQFIALDTQLQDYTEYTFASVFGSAILSRNIPVVRYLYAQKDQLNDVVYEYILNAAAEVGDWGWIVIAIENIHSDGLTLTRAAKGGHKDVIEFFEEKTNDSLALLEGYVQAGNIPAIEAVIQKYSISDLNQKYALLEAIGSENKTTIDYFFEKLKGTIPSYWITVLHRAGKCRLDTLQYIYNQREAWPVNALTDALCIAIFHEQIDNIRFLLEKGADISQYGDTLIDMNRLLAGEQ